MAVHNDHGIHLIGMRTTTEVHVPQPTAEPGLNGGGQSISAGAHLTRT
jgi:hypothetical protein